MKKIICSSLLFIMAFTASACGGRGPANTVFSAEDARGKMIGVLEGTSSLPYAAAIGETVVYTSQQQMMDALKSGALDCVIMEKLHGDALARKTSGVKTLPEPLLEYDLSFAIAKENADLTNAVNTALETLQSSGALKGFYDKYMRDRGYTYYPPASAPAPDGTLTLAAPGNYPPYSYRTADGKFEGLDIDVARAVCALLGVELDITETELSKLVTTVQFGKADFALGGVHENDEDLELVDFSISYAQLVQVILVRS